MRIDKSVTFENLWQEVVVPTLPQADLKPEDYDPDNYCQECGGQLKDRKEPTCIQCGATYA